MIDVSKNILQANIEGINENDVQLIPCNTGVLVKFYDDNPYRHVDRMDSGLVIGIESTQKYKSNETGEMEENEEVISCAKVIAVGPECKNVHVGEDVYLVKWIAKPIPFRKQSYYIISEQNILCRIVNK